MVTVDGFPVPVDVAGPDKGSVVVLLGAAQQAASAYDAVCQRLHTASLRTIVVGPDPRLTAKSVVGIMDMLEVQWGLLVGDRIGGELAWELAATRLDRFIGLVVIDRGHPRVADQSGVIRDEHCPPVEMNTTALVSTPAARAVARASQRYVYGDFRLVELLGPAQRAGVDRAAGRRDRDAHQHVVTASQSGASVRRPRLRQRRAAGEQVVDERLRGRLRLVVGQPGPLVGLDEHVLVRRSTSGTSRSMPVTGMPIASAAATATSHSVWFTSAVTSWIVPPWCRFAVRRTRSRSPSGSTSSNDQPASLTVASVTSSSGMLGLAAGGRAAPPALRLDQLAHGVMAGADDLGGHAQRGGDDLAVDHHQPQVVARRTLLDQHLRVLLAGPGQRRLEFGRAVHTDGDALALLAPRRLDHHVADLGEERVVVVVEGRQPALGHDDSGLGHQPSGQPLVVASAHRDRGGELRQRLSGDDAAAAVRQPHLAGLGVEHLDPDPRRIASSAMIRAYGLRSSTVSGGWVNSGSLIAFLRLTASTGTRWKPSFS